jgi:hypothetical protein
VLTGLTALGSSRLTGLDRRTQKRLCLRLVVRFGHVRFLQSGPMARSIDTCGPLYALAYGLLFLMLARTMRLTVAIGVAVVMVFLSFSDLHARTQLLADGLIVIWVAGLVRVHGGFTVESQPQFFVLLAKAARRTLYPVYAGIVLIPFVAGAFGKSVTPDPQITPAAAVDYIVDHNDGGKVYDSFNFGGYLTFRKVPTLVDGRTDQLLSSNIWKNTTPSLCCLWSQVASNHKNYRRRLDGVRYIRTSLQRCLKGSRDSASARWARIRRLTTAIAFRLITLTRSVSDALAFDHYSGLSLRAHLA